jgi:hypothetical protein
MTDNLFLNAMDIDQQSSIKEIKANKEFLLKLIADLDKVFQTNYEIIDEQNCDPRGPVRTTPSTT